MTTPEALLALVGAVLIAAAFAVMMLVAGKRAGATQALLSLTAPHQWQFQWQLAFLAGTALGAVLVAILIPRAPAFIDVNLSLPVTIFTGTLLGLGAGLARASVLSLLASADLPARSRWLAIAAFSIAACATSYVAHHAIHGGA